MRTPLHVPAILVVPLLIATAPPAVAQIYEAVGTRAQGMGGAFVAVADDATVTWWNPAGLAMSPFLSAAFIRGSLSEPGRPAPDGRAGRTSTGGFAFAVPSLGLSYYRLRISEIAPDPSTGDGGGNRQDPEAFPAAVRLSALSVFGATVGQSLGSHLVLGTTVKLVRGGRSFGRGTAAADALLDAAADLDVDADTRADLDVGVMAVAGPVRVGVSAKNLRQPRFGEGDSAFVLKRQARVGVAVTNRPNSPMGLVAAFDADLTKTDTAVGDVRHIGAGGEAWLFGRHVGVRGGLSGNTIGERRPAASAGFSFMPVTGLYIDASRTVGSDASRRGWGATVRLTF